MTSQERVMRAIKGEAVDRTPVYGWVFANLKDEISKIYGSVEAFEDLYEFDAAHIFGGPSPFKTENILGVLRIAMMSLLPRFCWTRTFSFRQLIRIGQESSKRLSIIKNAIDFVICRLPDFLNFSTIYLVLRISLCI